MSTLTYHVATCTESCVRHSSLRMVRKNEVLVGKKQEDEGSNWILEYRKGTYNISGTYNFKYANANPRELSLLNLV